MGILIEVEREKADGNSGGGCLGKKEIHDKQLQVNATATKIKF